MINKIRNMALPLTPLASSGSVRGLYSTGVGGAGGSVAAATLEAADSTRPLYLAGSAASAVLTLLCHAAACGGAGYPPEH